MPAIIKKVQSLSKVYLAYVAEIWQNLQVRLHQAHGACFFLAPYDDLPAFALRSVELFCQILEKFYQSMDSNHKSIPCLKVRVPLYFRTLSS